MSLALIRELAFPAEAHADIPALTARIVSLAPAGATVEVRPAVASHGGGQTRLGANLHAGGAFLAFAALGNLDPADLALALGAAGAAAARPGKAA